MERQSFAAWRLPRDLDGVVLFEDHADRGGRFSVQERHFHDELELHFVERGTGLFLVTKGRLAVGPGSLLWIPPGRDHLLLEASADFRRWMVLCRKRVVRRVLGEAAEGLIGRGASEQSGALPARALSSLRGTLTEIRADGHGSRPIFNASVAFALARAWTHFLSAAASPEPVALHPAVSRALALLRGSPSRLSMPELAADVGLSESHLSKLFSAEVGVSVTDFRNRLGLERFLELYGDGTGTTLLGAALDAGFGSYPQFHRVFRRLMGYSPAEHRRVSGG
jgi:AraC-like DNA-binding protein